MNGTEPLTLRGRLVELRSSDAVGPFTPGHTGSWWVWRLEDMRRIGSASLIRLDGSVYWVGAHFWSRARYEGGYGAEVYRLMTTFAVERHGATKVTANATDVRRRAALEDSGFKLVSAFPPSHAKRRRGHGVWRFEWEPKA
jgi:RimJ/RimL family protein N-acetyltransferase